MNPKRPHVPWSFLELAGDFGEQGAVGPVFTDRVEPCVYSGVLPRLLDCHNPRQHPPSLSVLKIPSLSPPAPHRELNLVIFSTGIILLPVKLIDEISCFSLF